MSALVAFLLVALSVLALSCLLVLSLVSDRSALVLLVWKNCLMSWMSVGGLRFLAIVMVRRVLELCGLGAILAVGIWVLPFALGGMVSSSVSWVARVKDGVASGLGGALVLFMGFGSNIVPCLAHFARRAEGVWGMQC